MEPTIDDLMVGAVLATKDGCWNYPESNCTENGRTPGAIEFDKRSCLPCVVAGMLAAFKSLDVAPDPVPALLRLPRAYVGRHEIVELPAVLFTLGISDEERKLAEPSEVKTFNLFSTPDEPNPTIAEMKALGQRIEPEDTDHPSFKDDPPLGGAPPAIEPATEGDPDAPLGGETPGRQTKPAAKKKRS